MDGDLKQLEKIIGDQKRAQALDPFPTLEERLVHLRRLKSMLLESREAFREALNRDFGNHHPWMSDMLEAGSVIGRIRHFEQALPNWLKHEAVPLEDAHGTSRAEIMIVPKGVNGIIAPWNFPLECALVMITDMFAAGNRVVIKPSELAPACAEVLERVVNAHFDPDLLAVVQGGPAFAQAFAAMPWDHLTYTGSTRVGRLVAEAAARNLVPLTLELGGKNPAIFATDGVTAEMIKLFLSFRTLKAGQVCTSPDYVLVPRDRLDAWVTIARQEWTSAYQTSIGHPDTTGIINERHYHRVLGYVEEARAKGVRVENLTGEKPDAARRQVPLTLIVDPPDELACMQEEVFGPVIPVVPYDSIGSCVSRINAGPTPLAAYIVTDEQDLAQRLVTQIRCGGAGVNTFGLQGSHPALPFGGMGASGYGCHSGREGFLNYSHRRSVFHAGHDSIVHQALSIPLSPICGAVVDAMFRPDEGASNA